MAEPRGGNVFAVRITSLHMELVSYMLSEAWILSPERNCLLRPRQLSLSDAACSDLPPARTSWPGPLNPFKRLRPK